MSYFIPFNDLTIEQLENNLTIAITDMNDCVSNLAEKSTISWDNIMQPLQHHFLVLNRWWGVTEHLQSVKDSPELRVLHEKFQPQITELYVNLGQNKALYRHVQAIKDNEYPHLSPERQKVIDNELRDFRLSGITLSDAGQQQFKQIQTELSELSTKFEHNVLDATDSYSRYVSLDELAGVPADSLNFYQALANADGKEGYKISLHMPSYLPIMQYADNRALRQELYYAYVTRASELSNDGKFNNASLIQDILRLRNDKAKLLGFTDYAELSLFNKMAESSSQVLEFLYQLANKARPFAENDMLELRKFAKDSDGLDELMAWDIPYYSEKLQQHKYSYSSNELKQYFPLPKVFTGLFALLNELFAISLQVNPEMPVWHPDVTGYSVIQNDNIIGYIYFDLYARSGKQPGAWMNSAADRNFDNCESRLPIAYIVCNFTAPVQDKASLLTFDDVQTLFHEMGHGLHHLLTRINNPAIAGINGVEWDAVELPSQFMEYFAWNYQILQTITEHSQSGAVLPLELFNKVLASRHYQSGLMTLRQLEFAIFDLRLHSEFNPLTDNYLQLLNEVRQQIAVVIPPEYNRFANSFGHIFAGGYAAGYYSYKWAEVLACDVFSIFDGKSGSELRQLGAKYHQEILSQGSLRSMMTNFTAFMGREPELDALLKYSGLN